MGAQEEENSLTLEGLAQRLEALERENERMRSESEQMRSENAELRGEVTALRGSGTRRNVVAELPGSDTRRDGEATSEEEFAGQVSRRSLLSKAGAAALAAMAAGTLLYPREARANHFNSQYFEATFIRTHFLEAIGNGNKWAVKAQATGDHFGAVDGTNNAQLGVGVEGNSTGSGGTGVRGVANKFGVRGVGQGTGGTGVTGVKGEGDIGVHGESRTFGWSSVYGGHLGEAGYGVTGDGKGTGAGVLGRNPQGAGIEARDSVYGGKFSGNRAQLMLVPKATAGKPTTGAHAKGEIYMDKAGALFVCVKGGTTPTWRKVTTTAT